MTLPLILLVLAAWILGAVLIVASRPSAPRFVPPPPARPARRIRTDVPHLLYCYVWADTLRPCYYGISNEPPARHLRHEADPDDEWWMSRSTHEMIPIRTLPNRSAALAAERAAIRAGAAAGEDLANQTHHPAGRYRRAIR